MSNLSEPAGVLSESVDDGNGVFGLVRSKLGVVQSHFVELRIDIFPLNSILIGLSLL